MKIRQLRTVLIPAIFLVALAVFIYGLLFFGLPHPQVQGAQETPAAIKQILNNRRTQAPEEDLDADPFGEDGLVRILFIGLDSRAGQTAGHCDAIQFFEMDKNQGTVRITAVPRGTYSPLPPGLGTATGDYYISNACGLVGLDYGINQIEKVLGQQADYLVIVGFSRAVGIIRELQLPATETLQWLRHRQGYAIGEPQRAHNHSTFLKQMLVKFTPDEHSNLDVPFQYLMYNLLQTDLSFAQARAISHFLTDLELADHPEKIALAIKPEFAVQNIAYDADKVDAYLASMLNPIKGYLSSDDYSGKTEAEKETELLALIEEHGHDSEFVAWSYENKLWLQFEDEQQRMAVQFDLTARYAGSLPDLSAQTQVLDDYILEMEYRGLDEWSQKGQELRRQRLLVPLENLITDYLGTFLFRF